MENPVLKLDIEIYEKYGDDHWAQAKYLVHGKDDVLWTNSIDEAMQFLKHNLEIMDGNSV